MAAAVPVNDYYDGFRTFTFIANFFHVPVDQVNFLITQVSALVLAGFLRNTLSPAKTTPAIRHAFSLVIGLALGYFCFGRQAMHLAGLPAICYLAIRTQSPQNVHRVVLSLALFYLSCIHVHRQYYDYGSYTLDITGPLMVITQKVTSLAYSIHDGLARREEDLTPSQRHYAVQKIPSILEYLSYVFYFQALMAGPIIFYRDYMDYVYGYRLRGNIDAQPLKNTNADQVKDIVLAPPPTMAMLNKVIAALLCACIFVTFLPMYPIQRIKEDDFLENTSILYKLWYLNLATMFARFKYYHAWLFADAISINAGLGLWYDENNVARWDLFSNVDVVEFETGLSFKDCIEHWNKGTNRWLRSLVYERVHGRRSLIYTYALSAIWHGFYPGYYLTFASGAFYTVAARTVRRFIRPYFLDSSQKKYFYDMLTMLTTRVVMAYCTFSFILLEFMPSIKLYQSVYFLPHLLGLAVIIILPRLPKLGKSSHKEMNSSAKNTKHETNGDAHKTS